MYDFVGITIIMESEETLLRCTASLNGPWTVRSSGSTDGPSLGPFIYYKLLTVVPLFAATIAIFRYSSSIFWLFLYFVLCLFHACIMYSIKCPHCRYYRNGQEKFSCFIYWNFPKFWKERSNPASPIVKYYAPFGILYLSFYPVYWLSFQWELLVIYFLSLGIILSSILKNECSRCLYFECSNNTVPEFLRKAYFDKVES